MDASAAARQALARVVIPAESGRVPGSAFALGETLAITALHVVMRGEGESRTPYAADDVRYVPYDGVAIGVTEIVPDTRHDVAVLRLATPAPGRLLVGRAVDGLTWTMRTQPRLGDPVVGGVVRETALPTAAGTLLQLLAEDNLGTLKGYSGSPVTIAGAEHIVVGVAVREQRLRNRLVLDGKPLNSRTLYAAPIAAALDALGVTAETTRVENNELYPGAVSAALGQIRAATGEVDTLSGSGAHRWLGRQGLTPLRLGLEEVGAALALADPRARGERLGHAAKHLGEFAVIAPGGITAGVGNARWLCLCHFALGVVARFEDRSRDYELSALRAYAVAPRIARSQWLAGYFTDVLSTHCQDIYRYHAAELERLEARRYFPGRSAAWTTAGVGAVAGAGAVAAASTLHLGFLRPVAGFLAREVAAVAIRRAFDPDEMRDEALSRLERTTRVRLDRRCGELCVAALAAVAPAMSTPILQACRWPDDLPRFPGL